MALSRPSEQDKISFAGKCRIQGVNNQLAVTTGGDLNDNNPTGPLLNHAPHDPYISTKVLFFKPDDDQQ